MKLYFPYYERIYAEVVTSAAGCWMLQDLRIAAVVPECYLDKI
jgi:hypothetical protein